ncbi:MAG TPA: cytochrome b/b6 domain-containing protein [Burkholderiales bacterium]|nr:cytochrome b/b6 domain-containing protein [Burkholderiales bacterium]
MRQHHRVRTWDLPVRAFHWLLVLLVLLQITTASIGGNAMEWHARGGYVILALLLFRVLWGFVGGTHARFADFLRGPRAVIGYARALFAGSPAPHRGHNPLGGWSVMAMVVSLLLQASTGLFANDDVILEGPLAKHVSERTSAIATKIHDVNAVVLLSLVCLHIAAIVYYLAAKKQNLILPMITGRKEGDEASAAHYGNPWLAACLAGACAVAVWLLVRS